LDRADKHQIKLSIGDLDLNGFNQGAVATTSFSEDVQVVNCHAFDINTEDPLPRTGNAPIVFCEVQPYHVAPVGDVKGIAAHAVSFGLVDAIVLSVSNLDIPSIDAFAIRKPQISLPDITRGIGVRRATAGLDPNWGWRRGCKG
jgi:hypothetical protein